MPWPNNFGFYRELTIPANATPFVVELIFDTATPILAGNLKNSALANGAIGADVDLVVYDDTQTEIDRDCSERYNTATTRIRFLTPAAGAPRVFRMYYGDPAFNTPAANLNNIYDVFDDFDGGAIGPLWQLFGGGVTVAGSIVTDGLQGGIRHTTTRATNGRVLWMAKSRDLVDASENFLSGLMWTDWTFVQDTSVHRNNQNNPPGGSCYFADGNRHSVNNPVAIPNKYVYGVYEVRWLSGTSVFCLHDYTQVNSELNPLFIATQAQRPMAGNFFQPSIAWDADWVKFMPWQAVPPGVVAGPEIPVIQVGGTPGVFGEIW
jgi:hypothetical protein